MKLYTYFNAMEKAKGIYSNALEMGYMDIAGKYYVQYSHLRDGLIRRFERIELKISNLEGSIDFWREEYFQLEFEIEELKEIINDKNNR